MLFPSFFVYFFTFTSFLTHLFSFIIASFFPYKIYLLFHLSVLPFTSLACVFISLPSFLLLFLLRNKGIAYCVYTIHYSKPHVL